MEGTSPACARAYIQQDSEITIWRLIPYNVVSNKKQPNNLQQQQHMQMTAATALNISLDFQNRRGLTECNLFKTHPLSCEIVGIHIVIIPLTLSSYHTHTEIVGNTTRSLLYFIEHTRCFENFSTGHPLQLLHNSHSTKCRNTH